MDEEYDVIVCGTGFKECILSGLLSVAGKKVLHVDRNNYYGGESASLNITNLFEKFRPGEAPNPALGANRDWNVDLIPKFVMASGNLVRILLKTRVSRYLEWKSVDGTYVYQYQEAGLFSGAQYIHKVPSTPDEVIRSPLMGLLEKNRARNFFQFCNAWDVTRPDTLQGCDPNRHSMQQVYDKFGLQPDTIDFVGHAVALYTSDDYLGKACGPTIEKIKLYMSSFLQYGNTPFIYPLYGLGGLPEGFSRLSAINRGTYMLNKPIDNIEYGPDGKAIGVRSGEEVARAPMVICDPSYVPDSKKRVVARVIRCICILSEPIPNTNNSLSCQIIIPQRQMRRRSDIYVMMVSWAHCIAAKGKYVAIVSTTVETGDPMREIQPALDLLGRIEEQFVSVSDLCIPTDDGTADQVFVTASYDPTSHFESSTNEVLAMWRTITGSELDLTTLPSEDGDEG